VHKLLRGYRKCTYVPGMSCSYWYIYCCVLFDCIWANKNDDDDFASFALPRDQMFDRLIFTSVAVASKWKAPLA